MSYQLKQYLAQAVVQHLDGNMSLFNRYVGQALDEHNKKRKPT